MNGPVVLDTNLLVLLIVALRRELISPSTSVLSIIPSMILMQLISKFSNIVLLPHILAEVSSLCRQIGKPANKEIQDTLKKYVEICEEHQIPSMAGTQHYEFHRLGLTDAVILHFCSMALDGVSPTLLTVDRDLANAASSLGCSVIDYRRL